MALFAAELLVGVDAQAATQNEAEKRKFADSHRGSGGSAKAAAALPVESFGGKMQMKGAISVVLYMVTAAMFPGTKRNKWHYCDYNQMAT